MEYIILKYTCELQFNYTLQTIPDPMHSASSRSNSILMFTFTVMAIMCGINFLHGRLLYQPQPVVHFQIKSIPTFISTKAWEQLSFRFDLQANLTSLYTWNLKQLYVYIEVEWMDEQKQLGSRAIVYDWILKTPWNRQEVYNRFYIKTQNKPLQYTVRDVHNGLKGNKLKVSLNVEYMPFVGIFSKTRLHETTLEVPKQYTNKS